MPATATAKSTKVKQRGTTPRRRPSPDEVALRQKYPHIVPGTLSEVVVDKKSEYHNTRLITIECTFPGCKEKRVIATSDLAQVTMCPTHIREARLARRRAMRAAAKK